MNPVVKFIKDTDLKSEVRKLAYTASGSLLTWASIDAKWQPALAGFMLLVGTWAWSRVSQTQAAQEVFRQLADAVSAVIQATPEEQEIIFNKLDDVTKIIATDAIKDVATIVLKDEALAAQIPSPTVVAAEPTAVVEVTEKKAEVLSEGGPEPKP